MRPISLCPHIPSNTCSFGWTKDDTIDQQANIRSKTMYVCYIVMEIYCLVYTNILSPFLFSMRKYFATPVLYHGFHIIINYAKTFED